MTLCEVKGLDPIEVRMLKPGPKEGGGGSTSSASKPEVGRDYHTRWAQSTPRKRGAQATPVAERSSRSWMMRRIMEGAA